MKTQCAALSTMRRRLVMRDAKTFGAQIITPVIVCLFLLLSQILTNFILSSQEPNPPQKLLPRVSRCQTGPGLDSCDTIIYGPGNSPWVTRLMRNLAIAEGLDPDRDLRPFGNTSFFGALDLVNDFKLLTNYTLENPNRTHLVVQFTSAYLFQHEMPSDPGYLIWYNNSRTATDYNDALAFNRALDEQIARVKLGRDDVVFEVRTSHSPEVVSRFSQLDVVSANGGVYFYLVPMIVFFVLLTGIVQEKEANLRTGMRMMGMSSLVYWTTWTMQGVFFVLASTLVLMASAAACQFEVFLNANQLVIFLMFFLYGLAIITVAMCLSAFISRVQTAQAVGYGIILLGFIFQSILTSSYGMFLEILFSDSVPGWVTFLAWVFIQYPPMNFAKIYSDVAILSGNHIDVGAGEVTPGPGFYWSDLAKRRYVFLGGSSFLGPPPYEALLLLMYNVAVWGVLSWYFNNILGEGARPWYFPFTRTYWGIDKLSAYYSTRRIAQEAGINDNGIGMENAGDSISVGNPSESSENDGVLVSVQNLCKVFESGFVCCPQSFQAVADVSFEIKRGEIFGLLGHNGAGKTTTINMLTGLVEPTSGEMTIAGLRVQDSLSDVRRLLGVCPQHDILFDVLTAMEHLTLYAQIKGMTYEEAHDEALEKLAMVGLSKVANDRVSTFSGGMKRRLSVSISSIGDPALMLLDEPSTGMDPVNQKQMWKLIQDLKKDRCILLTTHSMREAEVLADRVSVIAFGRICTAGTAVELKHQFGLSYNIHVQVKEAHLSTVTKVMHEFVPDAPMVEKQDNAVTFRIPPDQVEKIAPLLHRLQEMHAASIVEEYGITETSLEDVFLGVTREAGFKYENFGSKKDIEVEELLGERVSPLVHVASSSTDDLPDSEMHSENFEKRSKSSPTGESAAQANHVFKRRRPRPFAALMAKNARLQSRQWGTNLCQVLTPLLVLMIMLILKIVVVTQFGQAIDNKVVVPGLPFPLNASPDMWKKIYQIIGGQIPSGPPMYREGVEPDRFDFKRDVMQGLPPDKFLARMILGAMPVTVQHEETISPSKQERGRVGKEKPQCLLFMLYDGGPDAATVGSLGGDWRNDHRGDANGLLGHIPTYNCTALNNATTFSVPFYLPRGSFKEMQDEMFDDFLVLNNVSIRLVKSDPDYIDLTPDAFVSFSAANSYLFNYSYAVNENYITPYHRANNFTRLNAHGLSKAQKATTFNIELIPLLGGLQMQAMLQSAYWHYWTNTTVDQSQPWFWQVAMTFPEAVTADILQLLNLVGALLYPVALNLSLPMFLYLLVLEKESRVKSLMEFHGMGNFPYVASNFVFFFFIYTVLVLLFWAYGRLLNLSVFVDTAMTTMGMFWLLWGLCLISMSFFLSAFLSSKSAASMLGYVVALGGPLFATLVALGIYVIADEPMPTAWFIWPQFAMVRGIYLFTLACTLDNACYPDLWHIQFNDEMSRVLLMLAFDAVLYFVAFLYLDQVLPRSYGIPKHPLFFLKPLLNRCRGARIRRDGYDQLDNVDGGGNLDRRDSDVIDEEQLVARLSLEEIQRHYPLVLQRLSKQYDGSGRWAVRDFSLAVPESQVFGLLGENGAGKTTTISMLTGLYAPSSGDALVNGFSICNDIDSVHESIGVCPQFSILWDGLTVKEHLFFFARMKGVGILEERAHVEQSLRDYGLAAVASRLASNLSGGMKRRLCVAIALVGGSRVVFLDEPTTGLDPVSKRQLWSIVSGSKAGRSIILTTHDLFEAEVLSQRIGMMALGEVKALGSPLHLKNKFAEGFRLVVDFRGNAQRLDQNLKELLKGSSLELTNAFTTSREYRLVPDDISKVFHLMSTESRGIDVIAFTIGNLGIESVFERVFAESHAPQQRQEVMEVVIN